MKPEAFFIVLVLFYILLVGSPRDIANRTVKHVAPKKLDIHALVMKRRPITNSTVISKSLILTNRYWLVFSNPNPAAQSWVIETRPQLTSPWTGFSQGSVGGFQEASNQLWTTQTMAFYRVGFK